MTSLHAVPPRSTLEEAIRNVVKAYCEAWNTHDMKGLAELFVDDAHWINIVGMHWPGRPAVVAGHAAYHQTFFRTTGIEMADMEIREISSDVASRRHPAGCRAAGRGEPRSAPARTASASASQLPARGPGG